MTKQVKRILPLFAVFFFAAISLALGSEGGGGGEEGSRLWELVWRIVNFIILAAILYKLSADKIRKYFSERSSDIAKLLDDVDKAKKETEAKYAEYQNKIADVEKEIGEIRNLLVGEIEKEKSRIIEEGKIASEKIIVQAKESAQHEVEKAREDLKEAVAEMACKMASDIITEKITADDQKRIVDEYLDKVVR
jgi:F-type H+-transporting ATPase subunit b